MATWPSTLPQEFHQQGFSLDFPEGAIRTDMDTGKPFQRKRFSAAVQPVRGQMWLSPSQYDDLIEFWDNTLGMGALDFDWVHPITGNPVKMRFVADSPPAISSVTADLYQVRLSMEIIPQ